MVPDVDPLFPSSIYPSEDLNDFEAESQALFANLKRSLDEPLRTKVGSCTTDLQKFYQSPEIRIRFAIGYEDHSPKDLVTDLLEMSHLQKLLTRPCADQARLCGFKTIREESALKVLQKNLTTSASLVVTIVSSSISTTDSKNQKHPEQLLKSRWAAEQFLTSFEEDDVIIYWGHGRHGGGPDFAPPLRNKDNQVVQAPYQRVQRGYGLVQSGLGSRYRRAQFVGLFGCKTSQPSLQIRKKHPEVSFAVTTKDIDYTEMVLSSFSFLDSILSAECRPKTHSGFSFVGPFFQGTQTN